MLNVELGMRGGCQRDSRPSYYNHKLSSNMRTTGLLTRINMYIITAA